jgi:DNA-binding transcriptional regulator YiaG
MVTIRRLEPSVQIRLPQGRAPDRFGRVFTVVRRRRSDFPPPTPQPTPCVLWQGSVDRNGYGRMKRTVDGKRLTVAVHRWVMEQVKGRPLRPDEVVLHACDNPTCFRVGHLSVGTVQDNNADMRAKGRGTAPPVNRYQGECHPMAKLSAQQVRRIRSHHQSGLSSKTIAEMFDVSVSTIRRINKGVSWRPPTVDLLAPPEAPAGASSVRRLSIPKK